MCNTPGGNLTTERGNNLPYLAGYTSFDAPQDVAVLQGCECTLPAHFQHFTHENPQVLMHKAALSEVFSKAILITGIAQTWRQHLAPALVELHKAVIEPLLKLVQVPLHVSERFFHKDFPYSVLINSQKCNTNFLKGWQTASLFINRYIIHIICCFCSCHALNYLPPPVFF